MLRLSSMSCNRTVRAASRTNGRVLVPGRNDEFAAEASFSSEPSKEIADSKPKLLYFDAANYTGNFFRVGGRWNLAAAQRVVRKFDAASKRSGWTLVAFFDQSAMTHEAQKKWRSRREREVRTGKRAMPQGALRLVGDMFSECGVEVRYSKEADCDDTIAFCAEFDGAGVLSQDKDFLRYMNSTYDLYKDYRIEKGCLNLVKQDGIRKSSRRDLGPPPEWGQYNPFLDCVEEGTYLRGSPSPLVKLGNLHIHVRPLRLALYSRLGIEAVEEEFPVLVDKKCVWDKEVVRSDETHAELLLSPSDAVKYFEQDRPEGVSDDNWIKHQFALRSVLAELCCTAAGSTLLKTLRPLAETIAVPAKSKQKQRSKLNKSKGQQTKETGTKDEMSGDMQTSHYLEWRKTQHTGESKKEKRERYLKTFPEKGKDLVVNN